IGAAWYEREHLGLGVPFPPTAERFERLEEAIQICLQMWSEDDGPYKGKHYQLEATLCRPTPVSSPRPRILIGGGGERKTLRLVAEYADACNLMGDPGEVAHKIDVLRRHCEAVGRDPNEIECTAMFRNLPLEPIHCLIYFAPEAAERYAALGIEGRAGYFASRAAAMGPVGAEVVIATFFNFNPDLVRAAIPAAWQTTATDKVLGARLDAADAALRRVLGDAVGASEMARAANLARTAAEAACAQLAGRPLFAAHAQLDWP